MGRDVGYVAALLDPSRPSRARPTPDDLVRLYDATAILFVELLEHLWGGSIEDASGASPRFVTYKVPERLRSPVR